MWTRSARRRDTAARPRPRHSPATPVPSAVPPPPRAGGREAGRQRAPPGRLGKGPPGGRLPPPHHRRMRQVRCRICSPRPGLIPAPLDPHSRRRIRGVAEGGGAAGIGGRRWGGVSGQSLEVMRRGRERERGRRAVGERGGRRGVREMKT
ncbi:hypothetical protein PVAP13_8KG343210 [Panicum virgatum]|uniref:Uncharacterized protein n=1 Tax=Panicum virgatum TaxID=38727 RepID=A0A8T0PUK8_PANVG|nr:hypothetical protein PVAP13_8KG343210 [Panicum virgatum]